MMNSTKTRIPTMDQFQAKGRGLGGEEGTAESRPLATAYKMANEGLR
jgi:hypothetical protein